MSPRSNRKPSTFSADNFKKTLDLDQLSTWAHDMVTWYWSADTLFWQVSVDDVYSNVKVGIAISRGSFVFRKSTILSSFRWQIERTTCEQQHQLVRQQIWFSLRGLLPAGLKGRISRFSACPYTDWPVHAFWHRPRFFIVYEPIVGKLPNFECK